MAIKFTINKKECDSFIKKLKELSEVKLEIQIQELKRRVDILENPVHERGPMEGMLREIIYEDAKLNEMHCLNDCGKKALPFSLHCESHQRK